MAPLLKNLLGNGSRDRELTEEMRTVLAEIRRERERFEALVERSQGASDQLREMAEPIATASADIGALTSRLAELDRAMSGVQGLAQQVPGLEAGVETMSRNQRDAESRIATVLEDSSRVRAVFEELSEKVDLAGGLKERLEAFLEVEKPFQLLRGDAESLRSLVDGTGEHLGRLREQHERLMDAHKLATSKMEALDRRREELSRDLSDKERRVVGVETAVRGMDGVRSNVDDVRRELGTMKVLADSLAQKSSALEAQQGAVDRALAQAENLDRAMRALDVGVRQQQENERSLALLHESVAAMRTTHEEVLERSSEMSQLQRQTEEQAATIRHELRAAEDQLKNAVERLEFEGKGLEAVSQRVADLRTALSDFEGRFKNLQVSSETVSALDSRAGAIAGQVRALLDDVGRMDGDVQQLAALRRDLDQAARVAHDLGAQFGKLEEARPAVDHVLRDLEHLGSTQSSVRDSLEQAHAVHAEIGRMREKQSETRNWLLDAERSFHDLRHRLGEVQSLAPSLEFVEKQTHRIEETLATVESRRDFVEQLHQRLAEAGAASSEAAERGRQMAERMEAVETRFQALSDHSEEAERLSKTIANVSSGVAKAVQQSESIGKAIATFEKRCGSVEELAERTEALRVELDQRQKSLDEAAKNLQRATQLRQESGAAAEKLEEVSLRLGEALFNAEQRAAKVDDASGALEDRVQRLTRVDQRLGVFEDRIAKWQVVDQEVARSLEQIVARQGTVQALQADLDRMVAAAEKTTESARAITTAHREIGESRTVLDEVRGRLKEIENSKSSLEERRRQMTKAEERLARAEGLLVDVRSSMESLQGQKAIVEQAVEKSGALRFMIKQAEAMIETLREERTMSSAVRGAVSAVDDDEEDEARAA